MKPQNVRLGRNGDVKLGDLGIAKLAREMAEAHTYTQTGDHAGTPAYMAPEQRERPQEVDERADVYSVGAAGVQLRAILANSGELAPGKALEKKPSGRRRIARAGAEISVGGVGDPEMTGWPCGGQDCEG